MLVLSLSVLGMRLERLRDPLDTISFCIKLLKKNNSYHCMNYCQCSNSEYKLDRNSVEIELDSDRSKSIDLDAKRDALTARPNSHKLQ